MCFSIIGIYVKPSSMEADGVMCSPPRCPSPMPHVPTCKERSHFCLIRLTPNTVADTPPLTPILFLAPVSRRMRQWLVQALILPLLLLPLGHTAPKDGAAR